LFKEEKARKTVSQAACLELMAVVLLGSLGGAGAVVGPYQGQLRNLFFYLHQCFLSVIELILTRVTVDLTQSVWAYSLKNVVLHKKVRKRSKTDPLMSIHEHCELINNALRQLVTLRGLISPGLQASILRILCSLPLLTYSKCKEALDSAVSECQPLSPSLSPRKRSYTLVLDLDETLVHYMEVPSGDSKVLVRPGCEDFLKRMSAVYEVIIFTAAMQDYADWVIDQLDTGHWVSGRLYRQHTMPSGNYFLKDLSKLGRDLAKMIIIDNVAENFSQQPENGIVIRSWFDDEEDEALSQLEPLLLGTL
jgi:Dullard-like phosphatase family protein